ncbi:MAG: 60S ribosomal export protein NMD3 [Candidatus Micrarchaeota archaeon]|nr:60S ribosomal export protein NMD3 [Candidatus Micrarchaeota archaeon]
MPRFCPLCGGSDSQKDFIGELCVSCAADKIDNFPPISVSVCASCHSVLDKAKKRKRCSLDEEIVRILKLKDFSPHFSQDYKSVFFQVEGNWISKPIKVNIIRMVCFECGKRSSQYFEAIIQLRGEEAKISKYLNLLCFALEKTTFVSKIESLKEGIDIYVGSRREAISALNKLGLPFLRTEKLAGQRQGKRLYRTTLRVRLA